MLEIMVMPKLPPKPLRAPLAVLFAAVTLIYSGVWVYSVNRPAAAPLVELGYDEQYAPARHCESVTNVYPDSPAERAGLKVGDCILSLNGKPFDSSSALERIYFRQRPGDVAALVVERPGFSAPFVLRGTFRPRQLPSAELGTPERLFWGVLSVYPLLFVVVFLPVLLLRLDDRNAWLLALMFAGFIAVPNPPNQFNNVGLFLGTFARTYRATFDSFTGALFYFFFAVFPVRSPLDRRAPWLKWAGLAVAPALVLPGLGAGDPRSPAALIAVVGPGAATAIRLSYIYGITVLGLIALVATRLAPSTPPDARRRTRVILLGTLVGVVPVIIVKGWTDFLHLHIPWLLATLLVLLLFLFPLSFAYAVVKHRVLELPVLLKRSARYLLVKRGVLLGSIVITIGALSLFFTASTRFFHMTSNAALPAGMGLGIFAYAIVTRGNAYIRRRVIKSIDRAFFRDAYDAGQVMENLAYRSRTAARREELAELLRSEINQAIHPASIVIYLETSDGRLSLANDGAQPDDSTAKLEVGCFLSPDTRLLQELSRRGEPQEVYQLLNGDSVADSQFGAPQPECLVPLLAGDGHLTGVIALGARLSEEPYSREDKHLLASVASQAGIALESIRRGEEIAEHMEDERRAAQEMKFASEVQARLLPQNLPHLQTLDYAGCCAPAREIGGDYYDFLDLRPGRVAIVLADIAGKGVSGALLMANLQANLRSQYALALDNLERLLTSVNHLFYNNTGDSSYATLFFGDYDDASRRLRYVNCGHLPPLLLRADRGGESHSSAHLIERLQPTTTVLGMFDRWECKVEETQLSPGDTLVLYTDGVTEAENGQGEDFGENNLIETILAQPHLSSATLIESVVKSVLSFNKGEQADDITLVVAHCRA
jgi:sigma-B regulation protein RsbU (phosphoserine phosphatase)